MAQWRTAEYRFGIEEEMFLADARTRDAPGEAVHAFHAAAGERFDTAEREMLQNQIEICSEPTADVDAARRTLAGLRAGLAETARAHGLKVFAAGTHPTALPEEQRETDKPRYREMLDELQLVGRRSVVCGLHVHVEVPDPQARVGLMTRMMPFLPVLLALSTSSPFWNRRRSGLAGYRLRVYAELPRTGLPQFFEDAADYDRYVAAMTGSGAVKDATYFWWLIRPSPRYPTLELRVADSCTRLDDTLTIAALYRCLMRLLARRPEIHDRLTGASRGIVTENLWRAERAGTRAALIDEAQARAVPLADAVEALIALVGEDARALGCEGEVARAAAIARDGSSADAQVRVYEAALGEGAGDREALAKVIDWLAAETAGGDG